MSLFRIVPYTTPQFEECQIWGVSIKRVEINSIFYTLPIFWDFNRLYLSMCRLLPQLLSPVCTVRNLRFFDISFVYFRTSRYHFPRKKATGLAKTKKRVRPKTRFLYHVCCVLRALFSSGSVINKDSLMIRKRMIWWSISPKRRCMSSFATFWWWCSYQNHYMRTGLVKRHTYGQQYQE